MSTHISLLSSSIRSRVFAMASLFFTLRAHVVPMTLLSHHLKDTCSHYEFLSIYIKYLFDLHDILTPSCFHGFLAFMVSSHLLVCSFITRVQSVSRTSLVMSTSTAWLLWSLPFSSQWRFYSVLLYYFRSKSLYTTQYVVLVSIWQSPPSMQDWHADLHTYL